MEETSTSTHSPTGNPDPTLDRRSLLGLAAMAAAVTPALTTSMAQAATPATAPLANPPPTPAAGDPTAPAWPGAPTVRLWPGRPPGAPATLPTPSLTMNGAGRRRELWVRGVATPDLAIHRPVFSNGMGLLVLPGGGYEFLSVQNEGLAVANWFTARGYTVFLLTYRLPAEGWADRANVPLQDAQRAMRLIRAGAKEYGVDPDRVGVVGFSAGGHLAASLATAYDEAVYTPVDEADRQSARPAFAGLMYPVIAMSPPLTHMGSRQHLLGPSPSEAEVERRSPAHHVTAATPPAFLVHALDDGAVPPDNSLTMLAALRAAKVTAELHLFTEGGHGFGLYEPAAVGTSHWTELFDLWIRRRMG